MLYPRLFPLRFLPRNFLAPFFDLPYGSELSVESVSLACGCEAFAEDELSETIVVNGPVEWSDAMWDQIVFSQLKECGLIGVRFSLFFPHDDDEPLDSLKADPIYLKMLEGIEPFVGKDEDSNPEMGADEDCIVEVSVLNSEVGSGDKVREVRISFMNLAILDSVLGYVSESLPKMPKEFFGVRFGTVVNQDSLVTSVGMNGEFDTYEVVDEDAHYIFTESTYDGIDWDLVDFFVSGDDRFYSIAFSCFFNEADDWQSAQEFYDGVKAYLEGLYGQGVQTDTTGESEATCFFGADNTVCLFGRESLLDEDYQSYQHISMCYLNYDAYNGEL